MKRWKKWLPAAGILLGLICLVWLFAGRNYYAADTRVEEGVTFQLRADRLRAFAEKCPWDGTGETLTYRVPDRVGGAKVTALGGLLYGTAFKKLPWGWGVEMPQTFRGAQRNSFPAPEGTREVTLTVYLQLGRYVSSIENMGIPEAVYYCGGGTGESYVVRQRWVVSCDAENRTYYARDGRLYYRQGDLPVAFCYESE